MFARAPASSANLGPGFDVLALALDLFVEVTVTEADRLTVVSSGEGSDLPADGRHMAARVVADVAGHDRFRIQVHSEIPVGRGLGSSAALATAAAAAAAPFAGATGNKEVVDSACAQGVAVDGHPENAAASAYGGLVAATMVHGRPVVRHLPVDRDLAAVLVIPDRKLSTSKARGSLPEQVRFADATFNLGRLGLLICGLADRRQLVPEAFEDRLHQDARGLLFPQAAEIILSLRSAGALGACWSGAGPTILGLCDRASSNQLADAAHDALSSAGVPGKVLVAGIDHEGVKLDSAGR